MKLPRINILFGTIISAITIGSAWYWLIFVSTLSLEMEALDPPQMLGIVTVYLCMIITCAVFVFLMTKEE
jgi:hypothetical protein